MAKRPMGLLFATAFGTWAFLGLPARGAHGPQEVASPALLSPALPTPVATSSTAVLNPTDPEIQQLQGELERILTSTGNRRGRWGVLAVSLDRGDTILALNPGEPMVPASNTKLLTTAAALHFLGPDFRYRTFLLSAGTQEGDVLHGDIILYGTGDPTLSERYYPNEAAALDSLAQGLLRRGIREILGDLVVDGTFFHGPELHPDWKVEDLNETFAAPVTALALAENIVTVRVEAGAWMGARPSVFTIPEGAEIPVANIAHTVQAGSRSRIWLNRGAPSDPIGIEGEIPLGGADVWRRLPVGNPLEFAGIQMKRALERRGVKLSGRVVTVLDPVASRIAGDPVLSLQYGEPSPRIISSLESPPLGEILRVINKESHNLFAETVYKTVGRLVLGDGSFSGGAEAVARFLAQEVGIPREEVMVRDGSGLSESNQASASAFVRLLAYMLASPHGEEFLNTLPEAGVRRELGRMYRTPAAGNLRAKTGTMDRTSALSGMVHTRSGERILFSILSNDVPSEYRAKRAEDQLGIRLASLTRPLPE